MRVRPRQGPVVLVGLRGSGKTTLGEALARRRGARFVDLDDQVVALRAKLAGEPPAASAGELFVTLGAEAFRALEWAALRSLLGTEPEASGDLVVATGGGVVETAACRELLQRVRCVWLDVDLDELARRLALDPTPRPALLGGDPVGEIPQIAERRASWYRAVAWRTVAVGDPDPDAALDAIERALERGPDASD